MVIRTLLRSKVHPQITVELSGTLIRYDGVRQDFSSEKEARQEFDRFVRARQRDGYTLGEVVVVEPEAIVSPVPSDAHTVSDESHLPDIQYDEQHRLRITFDLDSETTCEACRTVAERVQAESPRVVHVVCEDVSPGESWQEAFTHVRVPSVEDFIFDTPWQTQSQQSKNSLGDLRSTLEALPSLRRLFVTGGLALTKASHENLCELHALGDPLSSTFLRELALSKLPKLRRVVLSLQSDSGPGFDDDAVAAILSIDAPLLTSVHLLSVEDVPSVLAQLTASARMTQWKELSIRGPVASDEIVEFIDANGDRLVGLERLALPLRPITSPVVLERLRAACPPLSDVREIHGLGLPATYDSW